MGKKKVIVESVKPSHLANGGGLKMELTPDREKRIAEAQDAFKRQSKMLSGMQFKPLDWITSSKK